jgi:Xaa-Pro dipeptidase
MTEPAFPPEEFAARLARVRDAMTGACLDGLVVSVPENIYYLTGLDHWGWFACHLLIVPVEGEPLLLARGMERATAEAMVSNARFLGHADHEDIADLAVDALAGAGLAEARLGLEMRSLFLTPRIADAVRSGTPRAAWTDASGLVDASRRVLSRRERVHLRAAARAADAGTVAAIEAVRDGAADHAVAAECHRAMIAAGSEYPGFGPFIRPGARLAEEHTTWRGDVFRSGDAVFLEIAAAVAKYQAPMGRLVYVGRAPDGADGMAELARDGMRAIVAALRPGARAGDVYAAWHAVAAGAGLPAYHRHHCGYLVGIGFPPSWTGGSMVSGLAPGSELRIEAGMAVHAHSWFAGTGRPDFFISNTVLVEDEGAEVLTRETPETLLLR